jgi:hypothetical protein
VGSSKKKVDYALFADGSPAIFVEAKGRDTTVPESHADQLRSYMRQEWVDWGLLTNGEAFHVSRLKKDGDKPDVELLRRIELADLTANDWLLAALSKESVQSGASTGIYERVERRRQAINALSDGKSEIAEAIRQTVVDRVGEVASQPAESLSKTFVDDLIAELQGDQNDGRDAAGNSTQSETTSDHGEDTETETDDPSGAYVIKISTKTNRPRSATTVRPTSWERPWIISLKNTT